MPALIGPVSIHNVSGGTVHFGDSLNVSPKSTAKTFLGAGGANTGVFIATGSGISGTNVLDTKLLDQPMTGNK
ncbi:spore germination protein [Neobacillus notoginsengisoli]|uniref:Spore germination protein n=1 Tax=Neobacillus notoginsengisoli TaxID=1578198 RepID=A0A417YZR0_9BACI|nr:spore germination protein [Neobacillus notoginsengisoli]RHW43161.1 spore germination protein [Neobacillus notoginsengisoli]